MGKGKYIWALLRIAMGFIFLWVFLDKTFGLGFSTASDKSWLLGNSPTLGYLKGATYGPFSGIFQSIAGSTLTDWLFMMGMLFAGIALILGIAVKIAAYSASLMMLFIWLSAFPPKQNPFVDEHIIYILVLFGLAFADAGQWFGLGKWWQETSLVKKYPFLK